MGEMMYAQIEIGSTGFKKKNIQIFSDIDALAVSMSENSLTMRLKSRTKCQKSFFAYFIFKESRLDDFSSVLNDLSGAFFSAFSTANALIVVDVSNEVVNVDSALGTSLFADLAGDASYGAVRAGNSALINGLTAYPDITFEGDKLDDLLRAGSNANAASLTLMIVHLSHAVNHGDSAKGALCGAGTKTETAVRAELTSAAQLHSCYTIGYALVGVFFLCRGSCTAAHYLSAHFDRFFGSDAHYLRYLIGNGSAADRTSVDLRFAFGNSLSASGATGKSASAAVRAGKRFGYLLGFFVYGHCERLRSGGEQKSDDSAEDGEQYRRHYNISYIHL